MASLCLDLQYHSNGLHQWNGFNSYHSGQRSTSTRNQNRWHKMCRVLLRNFSVRRCLNLLTLYIQNLHDMLDEWGLTFTHSSEWGWMVMNNILILSFHPHSFTFFIKHVNKIKTLKMSATQHRLIVEYTGQLDTKGIRV